MKPARARSLMQQAAAQGLLEPLFDYLESELGRSILSLPVEGPEWPIKRAKMDGRASAFEDVMHWLKKTSKPSPDGAQNTED